MQVEELSVLRFAVVTDPDGLWIDEQSVVHQNKLSRFIGLEMDLDRCEVEIVVHRSGRTAAAGGRAITEAQSGAGLRGQIPRAGDPHLGDGGSIFPDHIIGSDEVQRGWLVRIRIRPIRSQRDRRKEQGQVGGGGGNVQQRIGLSPALLHHLVHAVKPRPQIIEAVGPIGIGGRRPFALIQNSVEVCIEEDHPARQRCVAVIDAIAIGIVPEPAEDLRVVVANDNVQIRHHQAVVVGVRAADLMLDRSGMGPFGDAVVDGRDYDVLRCAPVQQREGEQRTVQVHLPCRAEDNLNIRCGLGAKRKAVGISGTALRHQCVGTRLRDQDARLGRTGDHNAGTGRSQAAVAGQVGEGGGIDPQAVDPWLTRDGLQTRDAVGGALPSHCTDRDPSRKRYGDAITGQTQISCVEGCQVDGLGKLHVDAVHRGGARSRNIEELGDGRLSEIGEETQGLDAAVPGGIVHGDVDVMGAGAGQGDDASEALPDHRGLGEDLLCQGIAEEHLQTRLIQLARDAGREGVDPQLTAAGKGGEGRGVERAVRPQTARLQTRHHHIGWCGGSQGI